MKKLFFILPFFALIACSKQPTVPKQADVDLDSVVHVVLRAIIDSNFSCLDCQDAFYMLIDTLQDHAEYSPDENIRIGAKNMAQDMCGWFLFGDYCTPEEVQFFIDSLALRLSDVTNTWYRPAISPNEISDWAHEPLLNQFILFSDRVGDRKQIICLNLHRTPDGEEVMAITLPQDAEYLASVVFHGEDMRDIDTSLHFTINEALFTKEKTENSGQLIVFGEDFIQAMLAHDGLYITYIGNEESDNIEDRWHDAHLLLPKFHEQYKTMNH